MKIPTENFTDVALVDLAHSKQKQKINAKIKQSKQVKTNLNSTIGLTTSQDSILTFISTDWENCTVIIRMLEQVRNVLTVEWRGWRLVSSPLDDLCIDVWISVMIIYLRTQMTKG